MRRAWMLILLAGCATDPTADPAGTGSGDPPPPTEIPAQPASCVASLSLDGMGPAGSTPVGPFTIDAAGIALCLHLDASQNIRVAHFGAASDQFQGDASPFGAVLREAGAQVQTGWDVTFGSAPPATFMNLEWSTPAGTTRDVILHVYAKGAAATTSLQLALFEPYE